MSRAREQTAAAGQFTPFDAATLSVAGAFLAAVEGRWPAARFTREWVEALLARGETGDCEQALSPLRQAAAELDAIGAPIYAKQAERRMNELARR